MYFTFKNMKISHIRGDNKHIAPFTEQVLHKAQGVEMRDACSKPSDNGMVALGVNTVCLSICINTWC